MNKYEFFYLNVFFFNFYLHFLWSGGGGWGVGDSFFKHISWTLKSCSHTDQLPFYPQLHLHLPSHSCSLKPSLSHRFLPISSHTGLWNFLSSNFFYPTFVTSFFWSSSLPNRLPYYPAFTGDSHILLYQLLFFWSQGCLPFNSLADFGACRMDSHGRRFTLKLNSVSFVDLLM